RRYRPAARPCTRPGPGPVPPGREPAGSPCRGPGRAVTAVGPSPPPDRKSTRLNSSHVSISYAVFCLKKKTPWMSTRTRESGRGVEGLCTRRSIGRTPRRPADLQTTDPPHTAEPGNDETEEAARY